jgi:hypothetical protein
VVACSDGTGPAAVSRRILNLNVSTGASAAAAAGADTISANGRRLVINRVELVISEFELKRVSSTAECGSGGDGSAMASPEGGSGHDDGECEEFQAGPMVLDLPLGGAPQRVVSVEVDTGTYRQAEFKIHKAEDQSGDAALLVEHPDLKGTSVRVTGTFDGRSFVYTTDLTAKQRSDLVPPVVVGAKGPADFTLLIDIKGWFVTAAGALIDPATAQKGQANDNLVRDNIRRSFRCFEDRDRDGHEG